MDHHPNHPTDSSWPSNVLALPLELASALNDTYLLHLLATDPQKIIPDGKSLLSAVLSSPTILGQHKSPPQNDIETSIRSNVESIVYRAFWKDAAEALASPDLVVQLERLKNLHHDILEAVSPLFPHNHPIIVSLSSPIPPTTSPIISSANMLREIITALKQRCAPIRDSELDIILNRTEDDFSGPNSSGRLADLFKDIIQIADQMKSDMSNFVLSRMSEPELHALINEEAIAKEKMFISNLWLKDGQSSEDSLAQLWHSWIDTLDLSAIGLSGKEIHTPWIARAMQSVVSPVAVACDLPTSVHSMVPKSIEHPTNYLPPQFLFTCPALLFTQNLLQALVIAATLRSLIHLPQGTQDISENFLQRTMALLQLEITETGVSAETPTESTKIVNLADEVVRVRRLADTLSSTAISLSSEEESKLRAAVTRTLQTTDPVFALLQKRLASAIAMAILDWFQKRFVDTSVPGYQPINMRTGRDMQTSTNHPQPSSRAFEGINIKFPTVKGFEHPSLQAHIQDFIKQIASSFIWIHVCWQV